MSETARMVTAAVCVAVGILIGMKVTETEPVPPPPVPVVSDDTVRELTDALEAIANQPRLTPEQSEAVGEARDLLDDIEDGEVIVTPTTEPAEDAEPSQEGVPGEAPSTTTTTAAPGTEANPLDGNATPTTTSP